MRKLFKKIQPQDLTLEKKNLNIIIAGLGKVGSYLATTLANENHNITVVDINPAKVLDISQEIDVLGAQGSIIDSKTINDLDMRGSDLFIAVTTSDEINLLACLLAKKAGCSRTIGRVRAPEYAESLDYFKEQLGLDMIINPEQLAAEEIERVLSLPGAIDVDEFSKDSSTIYKLRIKPGSFLDGMPVKNVPTKVHSQVLVCVDERDKKAYIPDGNFVLKGNDLVSIVGTRQSAETFIKKAGILSAPAQHIMIIGASKIAHYLTNLLEKRKASLTILDRDPKAAQMFELNHPKAAVIVADASDRYAMVENGLFDMDALVTLTGMDEENVFLSMFGNRKTGLKTVTKVNRDFYNEIIQDLDLDTLINSKRLTAEYIIRHVRALANSSGSNVETVHKLANDQVEALEFTVAPDSKVINIPLSELPLRSHVLISLINRNGEMIFPRGNDVILPGDSVIVITTRIGFKDLSEILEPVKPGVLANKENLE